MEALRVLTFALLALPFAAAPARSQPCLESPAQVVDDIYQQVLGRPADPASATFTHALASGETTVRDIVARLAKSPEHAERFFWAPLVESVYQQVMQRAPDEAELREAASGLAERRLTLPELVARVAARAAGGESEAIRVLYRRLLGREPDPEGLRGFRDLAQREGIEAVARQIVASPEYRRRAGPDAVPNDDVEVYRDAVESLYQRLLGRPADPRGLRSLTLVAARTGVDAVVDRIVNSPEYARMYGENTVPGRNVRYCGSTDRARR